MPSVDIIRQLQDLYLADDLEVPDAAEQWTYAQTEAFFESGGTVIPAAYSLQPSSQEETTLRTPSREHLSMSSQHLPGTYRWLVDISLWDPGDAEWQMLLNMLPEAESSKVMRFVHRADQKRALLSRLLQRRVCQEETKISFGDVCIERTKGNKPFMSNKPRGVSGAGNFNFNVSHEGRFVALAAEPWLVCGVDVAAPELARGGKVRPIEETLSMMKGQLTVRAHCSSQTCTMHTKFTEK